MSFLRDGEAILPEYTAGFRAAAEQYQALHDGIDAKVSAQLRRDAIDLGIIYAKEAAMLATGEIGGRIIGKAAEVAAPYAAKVASKIAAKASVAAERGAAWTLGEGKSAARWTGQMERRGWSPSQIDEALASGKQFPAPNNLNPANGATRFVHPETGRSVVIDSKTKQVIHVGGDGFKY
jgi:hypothetical protein